MILRRLFLRRIQRLPGTALDLPIGALENRHQFLVLCQAAVIGCARRTHRRFRHIHFLRLCRQTAGQVHMLFHLVPLHRIPGAVRTEDGIRRVFQIAVTVIAHSGDHFLRILTGRIALRGTDQPTHAVSITGHLSGIAPELCHRCAAL